MTENELVEYVFKIFGFLLILCVIFAILDNDEWDDSV
tara:strand:- start:738 stop:848 length:111 start_codon:yes stop_codon:yes gene_type:complete